MLLFACPLALGVYIDNTSPRHDDRGVVMDIHDGGLFRADGQYWYYGIGYQNCTLERIYMPPQYCVGVYQPFGGCGFREDHTLPVYSSSDLVRWRYEGDALPFDARPRGIYFRPKVIFDARTGDYVLWINYLRQSPRSAFPAGNTPLQSYMSNISTIVAKARSPRGPFAVVNPWARLQVAHVGDFALIVGRDGSSAYIAYDAWDNGHRVRVERLNDAWTETASMDATDARSTSGDVSEADVEAPILFERRGWYYLIYGSTCCFCAEGGSAVVMAAREPLGPWRRVGNINPWNEETGCGRPVPTQNNFVATVATAAGDVEYLFMGDLWTTAPDGLKSHDLQYWAPLRFDDGESTYRGSHSPPTIQPLVWRDGFELDVEGAAPGAAAPVVATGPFRTGSGLPRIRANQQSCSHSGTFEAWLLALIAAGAAAVVVACVPCCRACCRRRSGVPLR